MKNSVNILREKQFLVKISDLDTTNVSEDDFPKLFEYKNAETILQGVADCVFEEDDGYVLIDYKTDVVKKLDYLIKRYKSQIFLYKAALDLILDKPVKSCYIYSFHLSEGLEISL